MVEDILIMLSARHRKSQKAEKLLCNNKQINPVKSNLQCFVLNINDATNGLRDYRIATQLTGRIIF